MDFKFKKIKKEEFDKNENNTVLFKNSSDDNFGEIQWNGNVFLFGWRGDFILPVVKEIDSFKFCLGVDLNFMIVDSKKSKILFFLKLDEYFMNFIIVQNKIYIASELKIVELIIDNFEISNEFYLPEIFDSFILTKESLKVLCIDNQILSLY